MTTKQLALAQVALAQAGLEGRRVGATSGQGIRLHVPELGRTYWSYATLLGDLERWRGGQEERRALLQRLARRRGPARAAPGDGYLMTDI